jgi:hydroxymethylglutaryl-CoA synthase
MLITANPRIIAFESLGHKYQGVLTFKPSRTISKQAITGNDTNEAWFNNLESEIEIHKEQPFFDGQYSNECYMERTQTLYSKNLKQTNETIYNSWKSIIIIYLMLFRAAGCCQKFML